MGLFQVVTLFPLVHEQILGDIHRATARLHPIAGGLEPRKSTSVLPFYEAMQLKQVDVLVNILLGLNDSATTPQQFSVAIV